jgi:hypothetical protein
MTFPLSIEGRSSNDAGDGEPQLSIALNTIGEALRSAGARDVQASPAKIQFRGGISTSAWSLNLLTPITKGQVTLGADGRSIEYKLWLTEIVILSCLMAPILGGAIGAVDNWRSGLLLSVVGWLWLVGGNFMLTSFRFARLVRRAMRSSLNSPHSP